MALKRYAPTRTKDGLARSSEVKDFADSLGDSSGCVDLGIKTVTSAGTQIAHGRGYVPKWRKYNEQGGIVTQSQPPDARFIYLIATGDTEVGIEVW